MILVIIEKEQRKERSENTVEIEHQGHCLTHLKRYALEREKRDGTKESRYKRIDKDVLEYTELTLETLIPHSMTLVVMPDPIQVLLLLMTRQNDRL